MIVPLERNRAHAAFFLCILVLALSYALVVHEQLATVPWLSSAPWHPVWAQASAILGEVLTPSVSLVRDQPLYAVGTPLANVLTLLLAYFICLDRGKAHRLLEVVGWSGVAYAVIGLVWYLWLPDKVLWRNKLGHFGDFTSTFTNRDTAAVFFGMCATIWIVLLVRSTKQSFSTDLTRTMQRGASSRGSARIYALNFALCALATLLTRSRSGCVLSVVAWSLSSTLCLGLALRRTRMILLAAVAALGLLGALQLLDIGVMKRFEFEGLRDGGRLHAYRATLDDAGKHPWVGGGLGTFEWSYPPLRSPEAPIWGIWSHAHNVLLELVEDMGFPIAVIVAVLWAAAFLVLAKGIRLQRRSATMIVAFCSTLVAALHSLVDFSLQVPGYALVVFALLGAGLARACSAARSAQKDKKGVAAQAI